MAFFGKPSPADNARALAYRDWLRQRNPYAIASFLLGIFSIIEFGVLLIFAIAGIIFGVLALPQLRHPPADANDQPPKPLGHRLAWTGILLSALSLLIAATLYLARFR